MTGVVCPVTGFKLIEATWQTAYRIQTKEHSALSAPTRESGTDPDSWGRYDTPGETVYLADSAVCAFLETLASFKRKLGAIDPLARDAAFLGMSIEEFYDEVASQWDERHFMQTGVLPRQWRERRNMNVVSLPQHGWWIDIEDPESISAIATRPSLLLTFPAIVPPH